MPTSFTLPIEYFLSEGRDHLRSCLSVAFNAAVRHDIAKLIIFTAKGDGLKIALDEFCGQPEFSHIHLIGVTFPLGKEFTDRDKKRVTVEIAPADAELFRKAGVQLVRAHLPFDPINSRFRSNGVLGQDASLVGEVLSIFGGSMSLCVQAALMACDAGEVHFGEHAISMTSDTAILARVAPTRMLLTDFIVREVICKPAVMTIGKGEKPISLPEPAQEEKSQSVAPTKELSDGGTIPTE